MVLAKLRKSLQQAGRQMLLVLSAIYASCSIAHLKTTDGYSQTYIEQSCVKVNIGNMKFY